MGQLLRIAILLFGVWIVLRIVRKAISHRRSDASPLPPPADMLRCDYCEVFVPRDEAIEKNGKHYCSSQHADADHVGE
jgi:uncharacterized protein